MKAKEGEKKARKRYSAEFNEQVLKRAEKEDVAATAWDSELAESQLYGWRQRHRLEGLSSEEEERQHAELARLEEENVFLKKATAHFARQSKSGRSRAAATTPGAIGRRQRGHRPIST